MTNKLDKNRLEAVEAFVNTCVLKGISEEKAFKLVEQLCVLIQQKRHDEWLGLVDVALKEAGNEEGVSL
ncbi:hypothetical protein [Bacillus cereus]|uniref:Uncharacterized protein n=1 Tax=Bacillus cereus TaxID=1396 RepID=A0ABD4LM32_BACCE|nr:hypothetical protein [Bacillus cereus]MBK1611843.1 hypothetical protein [Bacillus cereus]